MTEEQTQSMPEVADIAAEALEVFCEDLAGMFDTDMGCVRRDITCGSLDDFKNAFAHLEAVCSIKAEGSINGSFHLILDREGSITLAALLTASSRNEVLARHSRALKETDEELHDAIAEAGNLLAASWERTCRGGGETQTRFTLTETLIGEAWTQLQQSVVSAAETQMLAFHCQMTIDPYPPFPMAIIFSQALAADPYWSKTVPAEAEQQEQTPESAQSSAEPAPQPESADQPQPTESQDQAPAEPSDTAADTQPQPEEQASEDLPDPAAQPEQQSPSQQPETQAQVAPQPPQEQPENAAGPESSEAPSLQESPENPPETAAKPPNPELETGPVSDAIKKMTACESEQPPAGPAPDEGTPTPLSMAAAEIMRTDIVWADPEDTVEAVLAGMQDHNVSHVIVGRKPAAEGIVSRSDIAGAMSPYLRPTFAKWRRPLDDATLRIKVKWIMNAPLTTIPADAPLSAIMEQMQQLHKRALPVIDAQGAIVGMITAFDIFAALLKPAPASNPAS